LPKCQISVISVTDKDFQFDEIFKASCYDHKLVIDRVFDCLQWGSYCVYVFILSSYVCLYFTYRFLA